MEPDARTGVTGPPEAVSLEEANAASSVQTIDSDEKVQDGIRAVNRQFAHDFQPHWHLAAELRLEGAVGEEPDEDPLPELRGDAIIYL